MLRPAKICIPAAVALLIMVVGAPVISGSFGRQDSAQPAATKEQEATRRIDNSEIGAVALHQGKGHSRESDEVTVKAHEGQSDNIVLRTGLAAITVTVTDSRGRAVAGLAKESFEIFDDGVKQSIALFSQEDRPISIGIVYDISGSMKKSIASSDRALRRFIEMSHKDDDFFLVGFADTPELFTDFTSSTDHIVERLDDIIPEGRTALFDAVHLAMDKLKSARHAKRAILVISDGEDNNSRYTFRALRERAKEADVLIYALGIRERPPDPDVQEWWGRSVLEEMARITGGRAFFPDALYEPELYEPELIDICSKIALELRHQYEIGFYPTDRDSPATWHKIKIRVSPPRGAGRVSVSYKETYRSFEN